MDSYVMNRALAVLVVCSICGLGYTMMSATADVSPVSGKVVIAAGIPIRQGDQVEYTFLEDTALDKLELTNTYIELDDEVRFGTQVSGAGQVNVSLQYWNPGATSGRVLRWNASSGADLIATFNIYSPHFSMDLPYQVTVDGLVAANLACDASRMVTVSWGVWSDHLFEVLIPDTSDDTADDDDGTDGGGTGSPAAPISVTGLDPYAWALFALIASSIVVIMVVMVSRSRKGRGGRSHV